MASHLEGWRVGDCVLWMLSLALSLQLPQFKYQRVRGFQPCKWGYVIFIWVDMICIVTATYKIKELKIEEERKLLQMHLNGNIFAGNDVASRMVTTKKITVFFCDVCKAQLTVFWVLFCGIICKWVLFATIDVIFY